MLSSASFTKPAIYLNADKAGELLSCKASPPLYFAPIMSTSDFPIDAIRSQFPALSITDGGQSRVYFDNPAGTQVPTRVLERTRQAMVDANANLGGYFKTTRDAEELFVDARRAVADMLNAASPDEVVFGANMTTLTLHISRSLARTLKPGDEIIVTRMDHDANIAPWLLVAEDTGAVIKWLDFDLDSYQFADDAIDAVLSERTKIVALGYASNCTGTINDVKSMAARAKAAGALVYVDAVQYAPHGPIDVQDLGCDFLVCSPYKFFGPHQGVLWGRKAVLEELVAYKVRPAGDTAPDKFETGTPSFEGIAGTYGAVEYFEDIGRRYGAAHVARYSAMNDRAAHIHAAIGYLGAYELDLTRQLVSGLQTLPGITVHGITNANLFHMRVPTVSISVDGQHPKHLAEALAAQNIFVWDGHNYALEPVRKLGLLDKGGVLRIGPAHYNTAAEIDTFLGALSKVVSTA